MLLASSDVENEPTLCSAYALASSSYSDVYRVRRESFVVALKVIRVHVDEMAIAKNADVQFRCQILTQAFGTGDIVWCCLRHANAVLFLGGLKPSAKSQICMISEWMVAFLKHT